MKARRYVLFLTGEEWVNDDEGRGKKAGRMGLSSLGGGRRGRPRSGRAKKRLVKLYKSCTKKELRLATNPYTEVVLRNVTPNFGCDCPFIPCCTREFVSIPCIVVLSDTRVRWEPKFGKRTNCQMSTSKAFVT